MFASKDTLLTRPSGYTIARSVRTRASASAYFNRTPATAGNRRTWTRSYWIKRGASGDGLSSNHFFLSNAGAASFEVLDFYQNTIRVYFDAGTYLLQTSQVFRDYSAWYHIVLAVDTTQATNTNRVKLYVNGTQVTAFSSATYPTQNFDCATNNTVAQYISYNGSSNYFDGYLTEVNHIDGQALTPSSFGETDSITGVWKPKAYSGTYGTNGFELNFSDNSNNTAATIGKDYSGNGNNWTPNNISVTAGSTYDSMTDVPTLTSATAANYAVINPLLVGDYFASGQTTFAITNGNLNYGATGRNAFGSIAVSSGKWYWEMVNTSNTTAATTLFGLVTVASRTAVYACYYNAVNGNKGLGTLNSGATETAYGATWTDNDVIGVAVDMSAATPTVTFYKNNTSQGAISVSSFVGQSVMMWIQNGGNTNNMSGNVNFGQRPFSYTPPTGFVALNTYNLPASTITNGAAYMAATLWTGNSSTQSISNAVNGISFQPDFVWIKKRSGADDHGEFDSVRGVQKRLQPNLTNAENTETTALSSFDSGGFTLGTNGQFNGSTFTYVGWQWKAGTTSASNTNGSITSTVSAGATQGFSVVTYTATNAAGTIGHGLGVAPSLIITKNRSDAGGRNWGVYHTSIGATKFLQLNTTAASTTGAAWNNTAPTSSVFSVGGGSFGETNYPSGDSYVAYCFAAVAGYSSAFSYTGNGSADGPFVYLGFRPRWVMVKQSSAGGEDWVVSDGARDPINVVDSFLAPNASSAEATGVGAYVDYLSNGFKVRTDNPRYNGSGATYIGFAFAENPFKFANAR